MTQPLGCASCASCHLLKLCCKIVVLLSCICFHRFLCLHASISHAAMATGSAGRRSSGPGWVGCTTVSRARRNSATTCKPTSGSATSCESYTDARTDARLPLMHRPPLPLPLCLCRSLLPPHLLLPSPLPLHLCLPRRHNNIEPWVPHTTQPEEVVIGIYSGEGLFYSRAAAVRDTW